MKYLYHTQHLPLTLEASDMNVVKWRVDSSYFLETWGAKHVVLWHWDQVGSTQSPQNWGSTSGV